MNETRGEIASLPIALSLDRLDLEEMQGRTSNEEYEANRRIKGIDGSDIFHEEARRDQYQNL